MDIKLEVELWEDDEGSSPVADFFERLPAKYQAWLAKRNDFFEQLTWRELLFSKYLDKVKGIAETLYEGKYAGSKGYSYRMLCFPWKEKLIIVELFRGSGSGSALKKHLRTAEKRMQDWKARYP